jgi:hypothetical protein
MSVEILRQIVTQDGPLVAFFIITVLASIAGWEFFKGRTSKNDTREDRLWAQNQSNADKFIQLSMDSNQAALKTNENMVNMIQIHGKLSETAAKTEMAVSSIANTLDRLTFIIEEREKTSEARHERIQERFDELLSTQSKINRTRKNA